MRRLDSAAVMPQTENCAVQLARFFPATEPCRVLVQVTAVRPGSADLCESTVVEFRAAENAIFISTLPLEFADRVQLEVEQVRAQQGKSVREATVVAVQYHEGRKAVAVRFLNGPCAWVTQQ